MIVSRKILSSILLLALACQPLFGCMAMKKTGNQTSGQTNAQQHDPAPQTDNSTALRLARLLQSQGRYDGALGIYAKLDKRGVMKPLELLEYASVASLVLPPRNTLPLFIRAEKALSEAEVKPTREQLCELNTGLGRARMAVGQYNKATQNFEKALEAMPDHIAALNALGVLHDAQGNQAEARTLFTRANELAPSDARILNNMALSYLGEGDIKQATRFFSQAISLSDSPSIRLNQAFTYYMGDKMERARSSLQYFMPNQQAATFMTLFGQMKERVDADESTIAEELLRAADKLIEIQPPVKANAVNTVERELPNNTRIMVEGYGAGSPRS